MDTRTLLWMAAGLSPSIAVILLVMWAQDRRLTLLVAWASTLLVQSAAAALFALRGEVPEGWIIVGANILGLLSQGMAWGAVRLGEDRRPTPWLLLPALLWALACTVPAFYASYLARVGFLSIMVAVVDGLIVRELRQPAGALPARRFAAVLFGVHGGLYLLRAILALVVDPALQAASPGDPVVSVRKALEVALYFYFAMVHLPALALVMLKLAQEKTELALRQAEARRDLLLRELNHRVKNNFAIVQATIQQTIRQSEGELGRFAAVYTGRIKALARAHDLLQESAWAAVPARTAVETALSPWLPTGQVEIRGAPEAMLPPALGQMLVLALHELATNAVKHGALSCPGGQVRLLLWQPGAAAGAPGPLRLDWQEAGGPPIESPPTRRGFGHRLLQQALAHQSGGQVAMEFQPQGLRCRMTLPLGAAEAAVAAA